MRCVPAILMSLLALPLIACGGGGESSTLVQSPAPTDPLAPNGWPVSNAPTTFTPTGLMVGDVMPDLQGTDQFGNADVTLTQFYGSMIVLAFDTGWGPFSDMAAAEVNTFVPPLEDESDEYRVTWVSGYFEDATFALADPSDGAAWATKHGLTSPVIVGQAIQDRWTAFGTRSVPTYVILDPLFEIRTILTGWSGATAMQTSIRDAWTAFRNENTAWVSPFVNN